MHCLVNSQVFSLLFKSENAGILSFFIRNTILNPYASPWFFKPVVLGFCSANYLTIG